MISYNLSRCAREHSVTDKLFYNFIVIMIVNMWDFTE